VSYRLQDLLQIYADPNTDQGFVRGYGAEMIVWWFRALQIDASTCDLSENILRTIQVHIRETIPLESSEPALQDMRDFLAWIFASHYTPFDYSHVISPRPEYTQLVNIREYTRRGWRK
jgi:hypothetical protein